MNTTSVTGVILAGGLARRMGGGDKGLLVAGGQSLTAWVLARLQPQVDEVLINANRHVDEYAQFGRVVRDVAPDFAGPLAGIHAGMSASNNEWLLSVPCDSPFLPTHLASQLRSAVDHANADIAIAATTERPQPVFMLARCALVDDLATYLNSGGRKIDQWYPRHRFVESTFTDSAAFANVNTPEELATAHCTLTQ